LGFQKKWNYERYSFQGVLTMHISKIERTELNRMILQHTQTLPEIVLGGCVICFINFDGSIESVGTRLVDLSIEEFKTLKTLIGMIEFDDKDESDYSEMVRAAMERMRIAAEQSLEFFNGNDMVSTDYLATIRKNLIEIELINARMKNDF